MNDPDNIEVRIPGKGKRFVEYEDGLTVKDVLDEFGLTNESNVLRSDGSVALKDIKLDRGDKIVVMGKDAPWGSRIFIDEKKGELVITPVVSGG